jgi:tRNA G18 (ribose-2'-O)-methylase SpoU
VIEAIERADDPRIEAYSHVGDHEWLRGKGLFVAEGRLVLRRLLESGRFPFHSALLTPAGLHSFGSAIEIDAPVFVAEPAVLEAVTGFNFHRGCLALAGRPADDPSTARFLESELLLALEGIGNPDNVGGLFRVAAAFGVDAVVLDPRSGDPFYRKAVRTSMGAVLGVPFERLAPWPAALDAYRGMGFKVVALTPRRDAIPLNDAAATLSGPLIVAVGAEGSGLSEAVLDAAEVLVRIPIASDVDSLNVTVAAAVALAALSQRVR